MLCFTCLRRENGKLILMHIVKGNKIDYRETADIKIKIKLKPQLIYLKITTISLANPQSPGNIFKSKYIKYITNSIYNLK